MCVCPSVCVCCPHAACSRRSRRRHCGSASCHYDGLEEAAAAAGAAFDELADVTWRLASHLPHLSSNWPPFVLPTAAPYLVYLFIARCDKLSPKVVANCRDLFAASASRRSSFSFLFFFYCLSATVSCCHLAAAAAADVASVAAAAAVVYLPSSTLRSHHASNSRILLACPPADCFYYKPTHTHTHRYAVWRPVASGYS